MLHARTPRLRAAARLSLIVSSLSLASPQLASAGASLPLAPPADAIGINQGTDAIGCDWPTVVAVAGEDEPGCTGALIHPYIVTYAGHCGTGEKSMMFGNSIDFPQKVVKSARCQRHPDYDPNTFNNFDGFNGYNVAYCVLEEPVLDLPITPPVSGLCEAGKFLEPGADVAIVGFGPTYFEDDYGKNWAATTLDSIDGPIVRIGGGNDSPSLCVLDPGGPAFVRYGDGSWHSFAVASGPSAFPWCSGNADYYSYLPPLLPWIEETSGFDVTPCYSDEGAWEPGPACGGFASANPDGSGAWASSCEGHARSGRSSVCGEPADSLEDTTPPEVALSFPPDDPAPDLEIEIEPGDALDIMVNAVDDGWAVTRAWIEINGMEQSPREIPAYVYNDVTLPEGVFTLVGFAEDAAGNVGESEPVLVYVGVEAPATTGDGDDDDDDNDDSSTGDVDDGDASTGDADDDDDDNDAGTDGTDGTDGGLGLDDELAGCGCQSRERAPVDGVASLMMLLLAARVRRRAAR